MNLRAALRQLPPEQLIQLQGELPQSKGPILSKLAAAVGQPVTASDIAGTPELLKLVMAGGAKYGSGTGTRSSPTVGAAQRTCSRSSSSRPRPSASSR